MTRSLLIVLITILAACSTPRPAPDNSKVRSGEETAKAAADAAREAEANDNTGLLVASSNRDSATTQPTTQPTEQPAKMPDPSEMTPTLRVTFVKGTLTQAGEPIVNFENVCADAVAADPDVVLLIDADEDTPHAKVMEVVDKAKKAGIKKFTLHVTSDEAREAASPAEDDAAGARLSVYAQPDGTIVVDGKDTGQTTPATISLPPGKHAVQVKFGSGVSDKKSVEMRDGSRIKLFFREKSAEKPAPKNEEEDKGKK